jgi:hypothetical protein
MAHFISLTGQHFNDGKPTFTLLDWVLRRNSLCISYSIYSLVQDSVVRMVGNHLIIPGGTRTIDATGKMRFNSTLYRMRFSRGTPRWRIFLQVLLTCIQPPAPATLPSPGYHAFASLSCTRLAIMYSPGYHALAWISCTRVAIMYSLAWSSCTRWAIMHSPGNHVLAWPPCTRLTTLHSPDYHALAWLS